MFTNCPMFFEYIQHLCFAVTHGWDKNEQKSVQACLHGMLIEDVLQKALVLFSNH